MNIDMLTRCLLALVMNNRPIPDRLQEQLLSAILNKFDKAGPRDIFYLCLALGKGKRKINQALVSTDIHYAIYLKSLNQEFDLYQLS
jgi:hypothetical protein